MLPAGATALSPCGAACNIEVSFDCVSVGCGVLFMLVIDGLPFFRFGHADLSCAPPDGARLFPRGLGPVPGEVTSVGDVTIHSSDEEGSELSSNIVGLGAGFQPCGVPALRGAGPVGQCRAAAARGARRQRSIAPVRGSSPLTRLGHFSRGAASEGGVGGQHCVWH